MQYCSLNKHFRGILFLGQKPPQGGVLCALPPWNHPPLRRLLTTKIERYCSWGSVAVQSTNTSVSLRQCIRHCSAHLPRADISITPFGGGSRFAGSRISIPFHQMPRRRPGAVAREAYGAHCGGVAGGQPD